MSRLGLQTVLSETFCLEAPAQWQMDPWKHTEWHRRPGEPGKLRDKMTGAKMQGF